MDPGYKFLKERLVKISNGALAPSQAGCTGDKNNCHMLSDSDSVDSVAPLPLVRLVVELAPSRGISKGLRSIPPCTVPTTSVPSGRLSKQELLEKHRTKKPSNMLHA